MKSHGSEIIYHSVRSDLIASNVVSLTLDDSVDRKPLHTSKAKGELKNHIFT